MAAEWKTWTEPWNSRPSKPSSWACAPGRAWPSAVRKRLHPSDVSSEDWQGQARVVEDLILELGAGELPRILPGVGIAHQGHHRDFVFPPLAALGVPYPAHVLQVLPELVDMVIFDNDLSPSQLRVLTELLGVQVLDRCGLILDIFAQRARVQVLPELVDLPVDVPPVGFQLGLAGALGARQITSKEVLCKRQTRFETRWSWWG